MPVGLLSSAGFENGATVHILVYLLPNPSLEDVPVVALLRRRVGRVHVDDGVAALLAGVVLLARRGGGQKRMLEKIVMESIQFIKYWQYFSFSNISRSEKTFIRGELMKYARMG